MWKHTSGGRWGLVVSDSRGGYGIIDALIPPTKKLAGGGLSFGRLVFFKKVDNKLVEFFIVEPVVMTHPVGGVVECKMELKICVGGEMIDEGPERHTCTAAYAIARAVTCPPIFSCSATDGRFEGIFLRFP